MSTQKKVEPLKDFPVTSILISMFVGLFLIQISTGVDANQPNTQDLLKWGANTLALSAVNEPWRLVTAGFLHIGIIHLMFNGFAIYFFGEVAESILGCFRYLTLFLLSVIGGNLLNCYVGWQNLIDYQISPSISAGASGGVMGIGSALLICALCRVRINGRVLNLRNLIFIMAFNLFYGFFTPGIDNAGHIGGAITGLILSLPIAIGWRIKPFFLSVIFWMVAIGVIVGFLLSFIYLHELISPYIRS